MKLNTKIKRRKRVRQKGEPKRSVRRGLKQLKEALWLSKRDCLVFPIPDRKNNCDCLFN